MNKQQTHTLTLRDGTSLHIIHQPAPTNVPTPRAVPVLLVHGFSEHSGRYENFMQFLAEQGFAVWIYDARGHGQSEGKRGTIPDDDALVADLREVYAFIRAQCAQDPIVMGHSMGGLTVALATVRGWITPAAVVLLSPALRLDLSLWERQQIMFGTKLLPNLTRPVPIANERTARDPAVLASADDDPLMHGRISPRLAAFLAMGGEEVIANANEFNVPVLLLYAADDQVVDASGSAELGTCLPEGCQARAYSHAYHELLHEPEDALAEILQQLLAWLNGVLAD